MLTKQDYCRHCQDTRTFEAITPVRWECTECRRVQVETVPTEHDDEFRATRED